jgi:AcrR family transcriptional regulator
MTTPSTARTAQQRILAAAVTVLRTHGADAVRIDDILATAKASASSLYHHFGDRQGLIKAAVAVVNEHLAASEDPGHLDDGYAATTHEEFCDYIVRQIRRAATSDENRMRRTLRVQGAAASIGEPPSADTQFQVLMTSTIAAVFEDAKSRHIINAELDSFAYCAWFQSMLLGQLLTEPTQPDVERWLDIATPAALAPLRLATSSESDTARGDVDPARRARLSDVQGACDSTQ